MSEFVYLVIAFAISVTASMVMMPWILRLCHKNGLYDTPNARKVHKSHIPRMGGVVFVPTTACGLVISLMFMTNNTNLSDNIKVSTLLVGIGLLMIYLLGILDDMFGLSANLKFTVQFVAALAFPVCGLYLDNLYGLFGMYEVNQWIGYALTVFLVMFVVNSVNTIDGIDGLCAGLSIIALSVYTYFFYEIHNYIFCLFTCSLIGSLAVYMIYNMFGDVQKGTKTFMGDSGSLMLGFTLSYLGIKLSMTSTIIAPPKQGVLIPLSVLVIPTFDLVRVAIGRMLRGVHPFHPDKTHIHHLLMRNGLSQHTAMASLVISDILLITLNLALWKCGIMITWIVIIDVLLYSFTVIILLKVMPDQIIQEDVTDQHVNKVDVYGTDNVKPYIRPDLQTSDIKVSIVVATYNSADTLADTLESILRQTYQNYEVVLCDGASQDDTMKVVESYKERFGARLNAVSEKDKGIYDAMNKGIERATGDIVGILNSDDFYTSDNVLERIVATFKSIPLLEAVYGDVHYVKPKDLSRPVRYYSSRYFRPRNMRMGFMPAHPSFYCLKELYSTYGKYRLDYKVAADFDQLFRLLYIHRIRARYIDMDFVTMRTGGASNSGLRSHLQIIQDHAKAMRSYGTRVSYLLFSFRYLYKCIEVVCGRVRGLL
ncbi:MAG: glycosyltransferase [Bacteroidaceae bacterium]|nr:glycosyltransferase [Bacteroidaceae bacterium]